ncbi:hypothetical protein DFH28DRAFT_933951 [Melampsora americana]|nr:hypothetical protein DFH28DRAFT_933951 [Melampsora americana]
MVHIYGPILQRSNPASTFGFAQKLQKFYLLGVLPQPCTYRGTKATRRAISGTSSGIILYTSQQFNRPNLQESNPASTFGFAQKLQKFYLSGVLPQPCTYRGTKATRRAISGTSSGIILYTSQQFNRPNLQESNPASTFGFAQKLQKFYLSGVLPQPCTYRGTKATRRAISGTSSGIILYTIQQCNRPNLQESNPASTFGFAQKLQKFYLSGVLPQPCTYRGTKATMTRCSITLSLCVCPKSFNEISFKLCII